MLWGDVFSYGPNNEITFNNAALTQILGTNGVGKSSISLILEEALYNKNSKGLKKGVILNRKSKANKYWITVFFNRDSDKYKVHVVRGSTQTVQLYKNDEDISCHTATATYAVIESLIGYDYKTFTQIVSQSSASSLEFLTATDGTRKKFLVDLLSLSKYTDAHEVFKDVAKEVSEEVLVHTTKINSVEAWLAKYASKSVQLMDLKQVPDNPKELSEQVFKLKQELSNIDSTNKTIQQNNKYKEMLDNIVLEEPISRPSVNLVELNSEISKHKATIATHEALVTKMGRLGNKCPTCDQDIDVAKVASLIAENKQEISANTNIVDSLQKQYKSAVSINALVDKQNQTRQEYERLHTLYHASMSSELLDKDTLVNLISKTENTISNITTEIRVITDYNNKAIANNTTVEVMKNQMLEMQSELVVLKDKLRDVSNRLSVLQILVKTFSPTGLIAYKLECLTKDLESATNLYLTEMSSGRFQLSFKIAGADKLNVVITDDGTDVDIAALSSGERARVNTSALLGIRSLLQALSNNRINLLILDETIENLDVEGKEKLVEILLAEEYLNTFVISHSFTHPLLEKLVVTSKNKISRID